MSFPKVDGFVVVEKLGSGSYSTVYKAYSKIGPRCIVAIKCVLKSRLKRSESAVDNLITEIQLLKTLKHPHIVEMKDFTWDARTIEDCGVFSYYIADLRTDLFEFFRHIFIVTEYCNAGDLSRYIHNRGRVPEHQCLLFLQQLACALQFLRDKGVAHMDLKPHNLLLSRSDGKMFLKVADFGFAQYMSDETRHNSIRGSPLYMAPEMLLRQEGQISTSYDARVDLWSVGVVMYECLFGKAPYSSNTFKELVEKIKAKQKIEIPQNAAISSECHDLLSRLLQHDPAKRISYEDFFSHEFLDLDHMPTKENFEKAVNLVRKAVEQDSKQNYEEAFHLYCESLRYFVPIINLESDSVKKLALRGKMSRYIKRAEELKCFTTLGSETEIAAKSEMPVRKGESEKGGKSNMGLRSCFGQKESISRKPDCLSCQSGSVSVCTNGQSVAYNSTKVGNSHRNNDDTRTNTGILDEANRSTEEDIPNIEEPRITDSEVLLLENPVTETVGSGCLRSHRNLAKQEWKLLYSLCRSTPILTAALDYGREAELYAAEGSYAIALQRYRTALDSLVPGLANEPPGSRKDMLIRKIDEWLLEAESVKALHASSKMSAEPESDTIKEHCVLQ